MYRREGGGVTRESREDEVRSSSRYGLVVGEVLLIVVFLLVAVAYALLLRWIAEYADRKGYSYWAFALFSLFVSPFIGGFLAYVLPDRAGPGHVPRAQRQ